MEMDDSRQLERQLKLTWLLLLVVAIVFAWPTVRVWFGIGANFSGTPRTVTPRGDLSDVEKSTVELFRNVSPSVVYLTTRSRVANPYTRRAIEVEAGTGSGFMWDEAGHVVTNFHVLREASSAKVLLWDQSSYEASLIGGSPDHDLAVLKINAPAAKLRPVAIGTSDDLLVGQSVFAIGNPFGLNQTLTTGVVSAKSRTIESPTGRSIDDVIQIDAAINPGNSGGPLLDSAGRLVGVNTAIYSPSGTSAGVGFSIPIDTVNRVVPQIIAKGRYEPPQLGVHVNREFSNAITERLGVTGALILKTVEGGPADRAGLRGTMIGQADGGQLGDIIQKLGDQKVANMNDLLGALEEYRPGDTVTVEFLREGERLSAEVMLQ